MKRYWLFGGITYYALGGFNDFIVSMDDLSELTKYVQERQRAGYTTFDDAIRWWHIVDSLTGEMVEKTEDQAYGAN